MIAGIILAAGKSQRMGRTKALLPFGGSSFLAHLYTVLKKSRLDEVRVVLGAQAVRILKEVSLPPVETVLNPDYKKGMLSSLQAALKALAETAPEAVIVFPVDHPNISTDLIGRIISQFRATGAPIIIPVREGRRGHPVLFAASLFGELRSAPLELGARHVVRNHPKLVLELPTAEPGILQDIDTPEDYRNLSGLDLSGPANN